MPDIWRIPFFLIAIGVAACAPATATTQVVGAHNFEAAIARLEQRDPDAPQALNARLQYADFMVGATTGDCHERLNTAQAQLDAVAARTALRILLPQGAAKLESTTYNIHAARADCDAAHRADELQLALEAARKATGLYRRALDYPSAAIMQFNVAATLRALGDSQAAITALEADIAMDRAFGFRNDARDNIRQLQQWRGEDESDAEIAELMKDFPAPQPVPFTFAWNESDAQENIAVTETNLVAGKVVESTGAITLNRHVRADHLDRWAVSYDPATANTSMGDWPSSANGILERFTGYMLAIALLETPSFTIEHTGDFDDVRESAKFSAALSAEVSARFGTPPPDTKALAQNLKTVLSPGYLETSAAEQYSLETATWAGAQLQQGVWYQMTAPLLLPGMGMGEFLVTHNIAFSYARAVPCTPDETAKTCAEIILHATPEPNDLQKARLAVSSNSHLTDFDALHYWATTDLRLVIEPDTLVPHLSDTRRSWYIAVDGAPKIDTVIASERIVTTTTYH